MRKKRNYCPVYSKVNEKKSKDDEKKLVYSE
jgi:hypothetical protein